MVKYQNFHPNEQVNKITARVFIKEKFKM